MVRDAAPHKLYQYLAICYAPNIAEERGITIAIVVLSCPQSSFIAFKRIPLWTPVLEFDSSADPCFLDKFLRGFFEAIQLDHGFVNEAMQWENSIRLLYLGEFSTSDPEGILSLLADAEFGVETN